MLYDFVVVGGVIVAALVVVMVIVRVRAPVSVSLCPCMRVCLMFEESRGFIEFPANASSVLQNNLVENLIDIERGVCGTLISSRRHCSGML